MRPSVSSTPMSTPDPPSAPAIRPDLDDALRVLVVTESFLPQVNGVTNSVVRVLDHLAASGHDAAVVAPTGPPAYSGFPVLLTRGASLPFYPDFRLGLETRRRLRQAIDRFRPDVVHIASPAALGYQAVCAARELGVPTVAIYQTDLVGFAKRYGVVGGARAMARMTRAIHRQVDRTLAPSTASLRQLESFDVPRIPLWPRGVDTTLFHPARRTRPFGDPAAPVRIGYVGRLARGEGAAPAHLARRPPRDRAGHRRRGPRRAAAAVAAPRRPVPRTHAWRRAGPGVRRPGRVRPHRPVRDVLPECAGGARVGVPVVAPYAGGPIDVVPRSGGFLYPPGEGKALRRYVAALADDPELRLRMGTAARAAVEGRTWDGVNDLLVRHYREVIAARVLLGGG